MSHFSVAVITKGEPNEEDLDKIMAPYQEDGHNIPEESLQFINCNEEITTEYNKLSKEDQEATPLSTYAYKYGGYCFNTVEQGYGFWININAKWDWWRIGGRWNNLLATKAGYVDSYPIKQIQWGQMEKEALDKLIPFKEYKKTSYYAQSYIDKKYPTELDYIKEQTGFSTYAVVDEEGSWNAPGKLGWFGCTNCSVEEEVVFSNAYFDKFIQDKLTSDEDYWITILDCHI